MRSAGAYYWRPPLILSRRRRGGGEDGRSGILQDDFWALDLSPLEMLRKKKDEKRKKKNK